MDRQTLTGEWRDKDRWVDRQTDKDRWVDKQAEKERGQTSLLAPNVTPDPVGLSVRSSAVGRDVPLSSLFPPPPPPLSVPAVLSGPA